MLAARGSRNMNGGEEKIADESLVRRLKSKARGIYVKSFFIGAALGFLTLLFP